MRGGGVEFGKLSGAHDVCVAEDCFETRDVAVVGTVGDEAEAAFQCLWDISCVVSIVEVFYCRVTLTFPITLPQPREGVLGQTLSLRLAQ